MQIVYTTSNFKGGIYRAVLAILLGLALLIWPADALKYVVMLIGIVFLAIGIIAFIISSRNREEHQRSFAPLSGIGSVILGLLLVCLPSTFATVFMFLLGFILVVAAVGQFVTLAAARQFGLIPGPDPDCRYRDFIRSFQFGRKRVHPVRDYRRFLWRNRSAQPIFHP